MTDDEVKKFAEQFLKALNGMGGSFAKNRGSGNSFSSSRARPSDQHDKNWVHAKDNIESLEKLGKTYDSVGKRMGTWVRDWAKWVPGDAAKRASKKYIESLEDLSEATSSSSKKMVDSFADFIKNNSRNFSEQQKVYNLMQKYSSNVAKLDATLEKGGKGLAKRVDAISNELNDTAKELKNCGFEVEEVAKGIGKNRYQIVKNIDALRKNAATTDDIMKVTRDRNNTMRSLHTEEVSARKALVLGLLNAAKQITLAYADVMTSRLQNRQTSSSIGRAFRFGSTAQEMQSFYRAQLESELLQGGRGNLDRSLDDLAGKGLQLGFRKKEYLQFYGDLQRTLMTSGIQPVNDSMEKLGTLISNIGIRENVTNAEAIELLKKRENDPYFFMQIRGKTDEERNQLLAAIAHNSYKTVKELGFSNEFLDEQRQQALNIRGASIVENIKRGIGTRLLFREMMKRDGMLREKDEDIFVKGTQGQLDETSPEFEYYQKILLPAQTALANDISQAKQSAFATQTNFGHALPAEAFFGMAGIDVEKTTVAEQRRLATIGTTARAEELKSYEGINTGVIDSVGKFEQAVDKFDTIITGFSGSIFGGMSSLFGGVLGGVGTNLFTKFLGGAATSGGGGAAGSAASAGIGARLLTAIKGAGALHFIASSGLAAYDSFNTDTSDFRTSYGMDANGGLFGDLFARTLGTTQLLGDTLLFGHSERISEYSPLRYMFDKMSEWNERKLGLTDPIVVAPTTVEKQQLDAQMRSNELQEKTNSLLVENTSKTSPWKALGSSLQQGMSQTMSHISAMSPMTNASQSELIKSTYAAFRNAGFSDSAAKAFIGEIGRENSFDPKVMFGRHIDPKNGAVNTGFFSWQGDRGRDLNEKLLQAGLIGSDGNIIQSQAALNFMAKYAKDEMESGRINSRSRELATLLQGDVDPTWAMDEIGRHFIKWAIDNPKYRAGGIRNRTDWYNIGNSLDLESSYVAASPKPNYLNAISETAEALGLGQTWNDTIGKFMDFADANLPVLTQIADNTRRTGDATYQVSDTIENNGKQQRLESQYQQSVQQSVQRLADTYASMYTNIGNQQIATAFNNMDSLLSPVKI